MDFAVDHPVRELELIGPMPLVALVAAVSVVRLVELARARKPEAQAAL